MTPLVITIILNTNHRDDTLEALASLVGSDYSNHQIIVLDNASQDGSIKAIHQAFPDVQIIELEDNRGYAGNNNVGIRTALTQGADWVFVLNEDTILAPDCLSQLVEAGERESRIGIVGPMVYHHSDPGIIQSAGGTMDSDWQASHLGQNETDHGQFDQPRPVDWVSGCAILARRKVIEQIGGLDERFFYYFEETEWCLRARRHGWIVWHVPQARLWHKGVQLNYNPGPNVTYYSTRNRLLMLSKHHAPINAWLVTWMFVLRTLTSWSIKPKWRSMKDHRDAMWQGAVDFLYQHWGMRKI